MLYQRSQRATAIALPCRLNQPQPAPPVARARRAPRDRRGLAHRAGQADRRADAHRPRRRAGRGVRAGGAGRRAAGNGRTRAFPTNPGAWLMATAKRRAFDHFRRNKMLQRKHAARSAASSRSSSDAFDDRSGRRARRQCRRRSAAPGLHLLPPGAVARGARRADAAAARRPDHRRDRARLPGARADDRAAHRARQAHAGRGRRAVRGAARRRAGRAPGVGAGGRLPHLQRRLCGDRRRRLDAAAALRGGDAARPHPRRPGAGRAGGARPRRADGDPGVALRAPASARTASRCCCSTRIAASGTRC